MQFLKSLILQLFLTSTLLTLVTINAQAAEITLTVEHFLPAQAPAHKNFIIPWKKAIEKESNGRIEVKVYPSMQLGGKAPDLINQVKDGTVDVVWTLPGYSPGRFPAISVFELPFMVTNAEGSSQAVQEFYETNQAAQDEFKDVHPLMFWTHDRGVLHTSNHPVKSLEDLKGLKIRAPSQPVADTLTTYGAVPVQMPLPQMPKALTDNKIDGSVIPWEVVPAFHIEKLARYHTEFPGERGIYAAVFVFAMNKEKYNSLPEDLKKVIDNNSGMAWSKSMGGLWVQSENPGRNLVKNNGNTIFQMSLDEVDKFRAASYSVHAAWAKDMSEKGLNGRHLLLSAYTLLNKYSSTATK